MRISGGIACGAAAIVAVYVFQNLWAMIPGFIVVVFWIGSWDIAWARWLCPRCGEPFNGGRYRVSSSPKPNACQSCGLPYGAPRDPDADQ